MSSITWENWTAGTPIPANATPAGVDADGTTIYIGSAQYKDDILPVKVKPTENAAYVAYEGKEVRIPECKVICAPNLGWKSVSNGSIPQGAVELGRTSDGERLYAGRVRLQHYDVIGKVHPNNAMCYVYFDGKEVPYSEYEVLVSLNN